LAALALAMLFISNSSAAAAGPVAKVALEGDYASAYGNDETGCRWYHVYVGRSGTKASPQTWLSYEVYDYCAQQYVGYGWGYIPNTAFKVTNKSSSLNFTITASQTFQASGLAGVIALTFTPNGAFNATYSGHSTTTYPSLVIKSHGWSSAASGQVSGTILSATVTGYADLGQSKQREMTIERTVD
jgi:hypothetical protein